MTHTRAGVWDPRGSWSSCPGSVDAALPPAAMEQEHPYHLHPLLWRH